MTWHLTSDTQFSSIKECASIWQYVVILPNAKIGSNRPHMQRAYQSLFFHKSLPFASRLSEEVMCLPIDPFLANEQIASVIEVTNKFDPK